MSGVNTLEIFVDDIADVMSSFNSIRVRRSTSESGPWTEITAAAAAAAVLLGTHSSPFGVVGLTMQLAVDSQAQEDIIFTGVDPLSVDLVAVQINAVFPGVASDDGGVLRLQSLLTGTQSKLYLPGGGALPVLGFPDGDRDIGEEQYLYLSPNQSVYNFYDRDGSGTGDQTFFYQAAFYNTGTGLTSEWSDPFEAEPGTAVSAANLSVGTVDLVDARGVTVADQRITFYPSYDALTVEGFAVGIVRQPVSVITNNSGHAEMTLVRGVKGRMVFESTNMIREITVPDADTFDIMALMAAAPDPWSPTTPDYPAGIRRTL
jgi:hypothetical protein